MTTESRDFDETSLGRAWAVATASCPDLNDTELWAWIRLSPILGNLRCTDVKGGPEGQHDFEAALPDGGIVAIEVTSDTNGARRGVQAAIHRHGLDGYDVDGNTLWLVAMRDDARVGRDTKGILENLIADLISDGRTSATSHGDYRDPFVERLIGLGIQSVHGLETHAPAKVIVMPGSAGGWGWDGAGVDDWLGGLLQSPTGQNKVGKLAKANAQERHLVVVLDSWTPAGMGIPLGLSVRHDRGAAEYTLPTSHPSHPLTDVWLIPSTAQGEGLHWNRRDGWAITPAFDALGPS